MAQDTNLRTARPDELSSRDAGAAGRNNDPLAELARLIGQNDPFADFGRQETRGSARPQAAASQVAPEWLARSTDGPAYDDQGSRRGSSQSQAGYEDAAYQNDGRYADSGYQEYQGAYAQEGTENYAYDANAYYDEDQLPPHGQESYEDAPVEKKRGGLKTIAAVVALGILGTGAVYGYRTWTTHAGPGGEPPVIKAEPAPTKIVPAIASNDSQVKQTYERSGDRGGERMVPREEQPVDVRGAARTPQAQAAIGYGGATGSIMPAAAPGQAAPVPSTEPKKVKTVPIRPDQPAGAPAPARSASAMPAPAPAAALPPPTRVATVPVQPAAARPAPASTDGRSYAVQVASQLSEADAQASFKALQQKYPAVLGSRQATIRRADLGNKVYYQVHVGPFATADQAIEMCTNLKSAGGQCFVPRN